MRGGEQQSVVTMLTCPHTQCFLPCGLALQRRTSGRSELHGNQGRELRPTRGRHVVRGPLERDPTPQRGMHQKACGPQGARVCASGKRQFPAWAKGAGYSVGYSASRSFAFSPVRTHHPQGCAVDGWQRGVDGGQEGNFSGATPDIGAGRCTKKKRTKKKERRRDD